MATRYYLIPFETDPAKLGGIDAAPKYLDLIGSDCVGLIAKETTTDRLNRMWLRDYYIVKISFPADADFAPLDAQPDVIHLTKQKILNNLSKVQALGIDTTGLTADTTLSQIQKRICKWATEEDKDFSGI